ncbi:TIGR01212 family radical SAM protein [Arsenophonus endosymbiont of Aphis craccivora]|uniref:TIGR01212 family radical SAM protein n=1 Tax=Arsenophonus endosymbiont of Aphis craccivora TaxID=1231049 RepID=UPI0015DD2079|nr:TIGR01212 family radical SAM protein [Arsenophonus endosymbiont of Aphis craccivora]QLK87420.1 TIGR01212 family radical SAM protein [Arsenophonus endosymbiont of Aphis craccivora]
MQLNDVVTMFGADLQRRYGENIHKISLHGGFNCPNRDGSLGRGGCTFCNVASFSDEQQQPFSIQQQIAQKVKTIHLAQRYLAYFQAYTNTYVEVSILKALYQQALNQANIVGLCVGTRPDCVSQPVLDLLVEYQQQGYEIWLELGLQTSHNKTLKKINRGHNFASYQKIAQIAGKKGLNVCVHLIVGLPGETASENLQTISRVIDTGVDGIKLHPLHIVDGSIMAKAWCAGRLLSLELTEYVEMAGEMIRHTPKNIIYHRICANARRPTVLAPDWCANRWLGMNALYQYLCQYGGQGSAI